MQAMNVLVHGEVASESCGLTSEPPSRSRRFKEEKISFRCRKIIMIPSRPAGSLVTIQTAVGL